MQSAIVFLLALSTVTGLGTRYVDVRGQLSCDNAYDYRDTIIELKERDAADPDDLLAKIKPSSDGSFNITGHEDEVFKVEFYLKITHRCLIAERKDCPTLTDEFNLEGSSDPKTITYFKKSLVSKHQTREINKNCLV
ncbi:hypothetical protein PMAYCL1PPCAC_04015 [Pristionchus mayeri]|uniref:Transthyretin-like family protein n=1 Tax=Pristionchus mayeri TaxID=1317129 RepID=A0AAN4Z9Q5_9BILA|nr:hypothetical protein PMAYCL1PPCAC_04015 [Pristionchus mayeri]